MKKSSRRRLVLLPLATFLVLLLCWEAASRIFSIPVYLMPAPSAIAIGAYQLGWALIASAGATLLTILAGFLLACVIGITLGLAVTANRFVSDALYPLIVFAHAIPIIAIAPIIVVTFGPSLISRLIIVVLIAFFPIMVATATGILDTPDEMLDLAETTGASRLDTIFTVQLPYAVSTIFGGLRIGITVAVVGAVVSEFVSSDIGLGYLVVSSTTHFDIPMAMAAVILLAVMSLLLYQMVGVAQRSWFSHSVRSSRGG